MNTSKVGKRGSVVIPATLRRRAEFLLSNAVGRRDYERARDEVREMGLDPETVTHHRPDDRP